jgi:hypothetical protein
MNRLKTIGIAALLFASSGTPSARADVVLDWNIIGAELPIAAPQVMARALAAMHGAMHDAINSIDPRYQPYRFPVAAPEGASKEAAAAAAAHGVLVSLVPAQKASLDAALSTSLAKIPDGQSKTDSIAGGREVAGKMIAWRAADGFDAKAADNPGTAAGVWQRTPPTMAAGALPHLGAVTPFSLKSADQFPAKARPALSSAEFARDYNEVKRLGGRTSTERTAEQTAIAFFWLGNEVPVWSAAARTAATAKTLSLNDNARLFALMHMAAADASIAAFKIKYSSNYWRPITAIRNGAAAGNGAITADPNWEPLLVTPPHPEFPSGHCILSGAYAQVLHDFFQSDEIKFTHVYPPGRGLMRTYTSFSQMAQEMEDARVFSGIHFRSTDVESTELGRKIGAHVIASSMQLNRKPD